MKSLIRLITRIDPLIGHRLDAECKQFFDLVQSRKLKSPQEAMQQLYQGTRQRQRFSELKMKLVRQLTKAVLMHPWYYTTMNQQVHAECWQSLAAIKMLLAQGHREDVQDLLLTTLRKAQKYQLHRIAADICLELYYLYLVIENNGRKGNRYKKLMLEQREMANAEEEVMGRWAEIAALRNSSRQNNKFIREKLAQVCKKVNHHLRYNSVNINIFIWNFNIMRYYLEHDYQAVVNICQGAIRFMEDRKIDRTITYRYQLTPAQLILGQYDAARENIKIAIGCVRKDQYTWSVFTYYRLLIELHSGEYQQAYHLYLAANAVPQISKALNEQWKIVRGYIAFLIKNKRVQANEGRRPHYRKFIESVPIFSQDKQGNNINIIILQLIHSIGHNNDLIIDRAEAIRKYIDRHMKSRELIRARTFIEMLLKIPRYRFHYQAVLRHTANDLKRLKSRHIRMTQNQDIEIIPYLNLWEMVLYTLSKNHPYGRRRIYR